MVLDDIRKTFEAVLGQLTPAKAQELARRFQPNAAKEQVSKTAGELVQLSQRMCEAVRKEVASQMRSMGVATQDELDALRKRVRDLERAAGKAASRSTTRKTTSRAKATTRSAVTTRSASSRRKPSAAS